ncbi:MAG: heavy metal-binding domain-containing protein [Bacteroidia bacterium]|nr:heavy metal-binding domain-containing protein [Bacteroidia bacterium]
MRTLKSIALVALMLTAGARISLAQGHDHGSPHGGIVQSAGDYHIELLVKGENMTVYLLDANEKAIPNKGVTGKATLMFTDKTSATVDLTASGVDGFSVKNDKAASYTSCVVTFKVGDKTATTKFKAEKSVAKTYTCPMHPEVTSDKPGKCPKCGMDLVEKKTEKKGEEHKHKEGEGGHHH